MKRKKRKYYIGIDIGGTKIFSVLTNQAGRILLWTKQSTPLRARPGQIYQCVMDSISDLLADDIAGKGKLSGIGTGVPGIIDSDQKTILATPNINLKGFPLQKKLQRKYRVPVLLGNDVNLGLLGEKKFGIAKTAENIIGLFPGTGIGGAVILNGKLHLGERGAAGEIGHVIVEKGGPLCGCGNYGCLEAMASRSAIEREIRAAINSGRKSAVQKIRKGRMRRIRSKILNQALRSKDPVVTKIVKNAAKTLGTACISLNHVFNGELIVLGGGVIEACGWYMMPIIKKTFKSDPFFKKFNSCRIVQSTLKDDAVVLGAVALVREGRD